MLLQVGARWKRWSSQHLQPCVGASTYLGYIAIFLAVLSKRPSLNQHLTKVLHEISAHLDCTHVNIPQKSPRFLGLGKSRKNTGSKTFPAFCGTGTCGACLWCVHSCAGKWGGSRTGPTGAGELNWLVGTLPFLLRTVPPPEQAEHLPPPTLDCFERLVWVQDNAAAISVSRFYATI